MRARELFHKLEDSGARKLYLLHKDVTKQERLKTVESFRIHGGVMVATDVFARGIDIPHLQWVLNFDLPPEATIIFIEVDEWDGRKSWLCFNFVTKADGEDRSVSTMFSQNRVEMI